MLDFFSGKGKALRSHEAQRSWIEVNLTALQNNVIALRAYLDPECGILAVVKADAYGHGMEAVSRAALDAGASWLGVASVSEGALLREAGIEAPIALIGPFAPQEASEVLLASLVPAVGERGTLRALAEAKIEMEHPGFPEIHLEIETGLGRGGVLPSEAVALWREAERFGFAVTGAMQHYAEADAETEEVNRRQLQQFFGAVEALEKAGAELELLHVGASASTLRSLPLLSLTRLGLLMYGIRPSVPRHEFEPFLTPVLALKSRIASIRTLPAGHSISYGGTHVLSRPSRVATLPIGYGDGYPRRLSNLGSVLIAGGRAPILGRVCMDQTVVDVTDLPEALPGDEAVLIGTQGAESIRVEEIAQKIETTVHEITACLTARLPRLYFGG